MKSAAIVMAAASLVSCESLPSAATARIQQPCGMIPENWMQNPHGFDPSMAQARCEFERQFGRRP